MEELSPILDQFIKTIDMMYPDNNGFIIAVGLDNDGVLTTNVGGNKKTDFGTAAKLLLDINSYVGEYYGQGVDKNNKL